MKKKEVFYGTESELNVLFRKWLRDNKHARKVSAIIGTTEMTITWEE